MIKINTLGIRVAMTQQELSLRELASKSGSSYMGCWNIVHGKTTSISFDKLDGLCYALRLGVDGILSRFVDLKEIQKIEAEEFKGVGSFSSPAWRERKRDDAKRDEEHDGDVKV